MLQHLAHQLWQLFFSASPISFFEPRPSPPIAIAVERQYGYGLNKHAIKCNRNEPNFVFSEFLGFFFPAPWVFGCWPKNVVANQIACRPKSAYESALERDNASTNECGGGGGLRGQLGVKGVWMHPRRKSHTTTRWAESRRAKPNEAIEFISLLPLIFTHFGPRRSWKTDDSG